MCVGVGDGVDVGVVVVVVVFVVVVVVVVVIVVVVGVVCVVVVVEFGVACVCVCDDADVVVVCGVGVVLWWRLCYGCCSVLIRCLTDMYIVGISWLKGNAECLPVQDNTYDAYTIAFGIRNCTHIDKVYHIYYIVSAFIINNVNNIDRYC